MTTTQVISVYISKLSHPLKEIRDRSLKLLLTKLKLGWELEDELSCTRELLEALMNWFKFPQSSLQKEALELFVTTLKTKSGAYIAKEFGIRKILLSFNKIKHLIDEPEAIEIFNDIIETLQFLNTVESDIDVSIPHLNLPSFTSSGSEDGFKSDQSNNATIKCSKESLAMSEELESGNDL
ncbi:unnamed protein product [Diatraea saccharalis]|uniref:Rotatin N-terminal domain-containing protein n=1 Tax=Diatraea saccharalis TaxID=40085 RepID=A0A9N9W838_9NEOP|nr:unnamed protein product [Diatraea saccharalis]